MAMIIDGKKIAGLIKEEIKKEVGQLREKGIVPKLAVILAGDDPASVIYARSKKKACINTGIDYELFNLPGGVPENELLDLINKLNKDADVHGIMVELPLPGGINKKRVLAAISPLKDVDGAHPVNRGNLLGDGDGLFSVTPQSCIEIMSHSGIEIEGKHAVLVGRGETVGKPLILMLLKQNATVTVCHTKTGDLGRYTRQADILIAAVGKANMITADLIRPGAVVIDAGINETAAGICGDVDFAQAQKVAGAISPVPGGVGSLTTVLLQRNLLKAIKLQKK
ncbi:MAG: Bifunctional protein FolD protein [Pelotomaculum sp. PtaB.Bin013]|uniref:Bifunctional protein FolD n=1 Tax=Pelotomaculum isophthalicicum JI TaxID=947010 RepID=A0A9X4GY54_9FIRM|nr:tetrahydrofolate dehydrogenase/cyclohydrolase catalytic domain-containing protein [Pelotomaculum isophthalicicum]MDF9407475.1 bifunctional 5,10-methylene-tetrahydrofolate dehydrogenase/5,10-methylene-tetrahydrofolate cyclohydrolase [Pelotomaculum isophthalicicum JI]OPX91998.1 MAG: Bifunctional protein FolD protein [Pelotomaculum sp. PtaB.Bin013]